VAGADEADAAVDAGDAGAGGSGEGAGEARAERATWERAYAVATNFVAPATFLTAVLFYYGYVSSRAEFHYFGLDVDTVGLSTRDYVMRSPQALLVPLLLVPAIGAGLVVAARLLDRRLPDHLLPVAVWVGTGVLAVGLLMLFGYAWLGDWPYYPMVTPLVIAAGLLGLVWCWRRLGVRPTAVVLALVTVGVCVFWATATLAQWTGLGAAQRTARHLGALPAVVLDTKERLYLGTTPDAGVTETELPKDEGQTYRYRYRGLRLLIQAGDRMFLVPDHWTPSNSTLLVPVGDVRVRFRFVDDPP
jgi:hypothetical protein